ncbi:MAG TPA: peptidylprolyl isomerase [Burkholderiales bacterium]
MKTWIIAAACMTVPALALGQGLPTKKKEPAKPAAIATVNGVAVPQSRMDLLLQRQGQRGMPDNDQTRAMVREELINREVIAQEAQRSGIGKRPEVQTQVDFARQEILVNAYISDWVRKNPISDADVQKEYERVKSHAGDKEYKARHILLETEEQANGMIAKLKEGGKFEELATKNSKDPGSAQRGGDLDWAVPGTFDPQFSEAMVKLEKGKYTEQPVRTRFGYHVIRLDDVRALSFPALNEARPRIQQTLVQNKLQELVSALRAKARIQ